MVYKVRVKLLPLQNTAHITNVVGGESALYAAIHSEQVPLINLNKTVQQQNSHIMVIIMKKTPKYWLKQELNTLKNMDSI